LPAGLTFARQGSSDGTTTTQSTLTVKFATGVGSVLVYLKNHSMTESQALRNEIISGKVTKLTFDVSVADTAGKTTKLAFTVKTGA
jgi:hypothetical protein